MTLTEQLIALIRQKSISEEDFHRAAIYTLDAIANAIAGKQTAAGQKLLAWGDAQGKDPGRTAFVVGSLTHILETDDLHRQSVTHPGCVVVPAVLGVAQDGMAQNRTFTGREILTAILHGFEAMCRVGNAVGPTHYRIWHNTATCGPYGSAMATACLLDLDNEQAMHALGNAGTQSSGVWEFLETGAMSKHLHAGRAAESGVIAAQLAVLGFTGPPAILEGEKGFFAAACPDALPDAVLEDPHQDWQLVRTSIKPWPSCRHTHPAIDAALELHQQLEGKAVDAVTVDTYQAALDVCDRPQPESEYEAKFSLYHTVAAALQNGHIQFDSFDAGARDQLREARQQISLRAAEPFVSAYPGAWGARVTVIAEDGSTFVADRDVARGDPEMALSDEQMVGKAKDLLGFAGCSDALSAKIIEGVLELNESSNASNSLRAAMSELQ
jgi:2-methylcitrate dehydratase PrpD